MFGRRKRDRQADIDDAVAVTREAMSRVQVQHNSPKPDLRIHALSYSIQSYQGRDVETAAIAVRAEAFYLFLTDQRGGETE